MTTQTTTTKMLKHQIKVYDDLLGGMSDLTALQRQILGVVGEERTPSAPTIARSLLVGVPRVRSALGSLERRSLVDRQYTGTRDGLIGFRLTDKGRAVLDATFGGDAGSVTRCVTIYPGELVEVGEFHHSTGAYDIVWIDMTGKKWYTTTSATNLAAVEHNWNGCNSCDVSATHSPWVEAQTGYCPACFAEVAS